MDTPRLAVSTGAPVRPSPGAWWVEGASASPPPSDEAATRPGRSNTAEAEAVEFTCSDDGEEEMSCDGAEADRGTKPGDVNTVRAHAVMMMPPNDIAVTMTGQ
eukprot:TRINITY_DN48569_c0_g1_i1.p3 TRINITY_DN48569_c0_g1~~TRINITY_DN48569_c0_g1_i1.p3  ORF type:complete len:103 (+),score=8.68 TRINITY_DN48569_c0_g1_i1:2-310(+)